MISSFSELKSKKILVIDTETTGLPETKFNNFCKDRFYPFKQLEKYNKSRMVQISWTIVEIKLGTKYNVKDYIVKPNNFYVPNSDFHKVTNQIAINKGIDLVEIIKQLNQDLESSDYIMAHNTWFDMNIIRSEIYRLNLDKSNKILEKSLNIFNQFEKNNLILCSGELSKEILKIKSKYSEGYKMPRLVEFYKHFFGCEFDNQHDSKFDVIAVVKAMLKSIY